MTTPNKDREATNDLNTIPASVLKDLRDLSEWDRSGDSCFRGCAAPEHVEDLVPLIEKLCQPNIVVVDLDDLRGRFYKAMMDEGYHPYSEEMTRGNDALDAALAALKENSHANP